MKGDIALVGFLLTAEEWDSLDPASRAQLIAVATEPWSPPVARLAADERAEITMPSPG